MKKIVVDRINPILKDFWFKKTTPDTRIYQNNDIVLVLNLQQSMYSVTFMINLWFYFIKNWKDDISKLKEYDCNIRYRLEDSFKNIKEKEEYDYIVDDFGEKYKKDTKILDKLIEYIKFWVDILLKNQTKENIKKSIDNWFFDTNYFDVTAKDIFGIKYEKIKKIKPVIIIEPYITK